MPGLPRRRQVRRARGAALRTGHCRRDLPGVQGVEFVRDALGRKGDGRRHYAGARVRRCRRLRRPDDLREFHRILMPAPARYAAQPDGLVRQAEA